MLSILVEKLFGDLALCALWRSFCDQGLYIDIDIFVFIADFGVKVLIDRFRCYNCDEIFSDTHTCLNNDKRGKLLV